MAQPASTLATPPLPPTEQAPVVDIRPLLQRLWPDPAAAGVTAAEIADALALNFTNQVSPVQTAALLTALHFNGWERRADVLAAASAAMRRAAAKVDLDALRAVVAERGRKEGSYNGGLCDMVGTGGDSHNTFNISTTSSILASSLLLLSKHGNRASTSKSGSADLLEHMQPRAPALERVDAHAIPRLYAATNYAFLFAPVFHPGMRHVAAVRRQLGWRSVFNLLGPLASPVHDCIEARLLGVARRDLGPVYADALRLQRVPKALVVCGAEDLDEISCAGPTLCWQLTQTNPSNPDSEIEIHHFQLTPEDFGLPRHPLSAVGGGQGPAENAALLGRILRGELAAAEGPILDFVLLNKAALFVVAGVCDADGPSAMGPGDDGRVVAERGPGGRRWKEGVRRARWAVSSGEAWRMWQSFVDATHEAAS